MDWCLKVFSMGEVQLFESSALSGKMLLVRIVENDKIDAYFRAGYVK